MANQKYVKKIEVVASGHDKDFKPHFTPKELEKRFRGKIYRSYKAVMKDLKVGESVIVSTSEGKAGTPHDAKDWFAWSLLGFGEVERTEEGWIEPRRLMQEY